MRILEEAPNLGLKVYSEAELNAASQSPLIALVVCAVQVLIGLSGKCMALSVPRVNCNSELLLVLSHCCSKKRKALCVLQVDLIQVY